MKVRKDFVTNSSSSSFVISRDDVSHGKLLEILLEIANEEKWYLDDDSFTWEDDVVGNKVAYRYIIHEATPDNLYEDWDGYQYNNHYIIDNDSNGRYDWNIVEKVLNKYNIPWTYGYCD